MPSLISFYWTNKLFSGYPVPELEHSDREQSEVLIIEVEMDYLLHHWETHKYMRLNGIHSRELRELEEFTDMLSILFQVPLDWRLANVTSHSWLITSGVSLGLYLGNICFISLSMIWVRGLSAHSVSLQATPCLVGKLIWWKLSWEFWTVLDWWSKVNCMTLKKQVLDLEHEPQQPQGAPQAGSVQKDAR